MKRGDTIMARCPSWWLNQPIWKIWVKLDHFPKVRGENETYLKPHETTNRIRYIRKFSATKPWALDEVMKTFDWTEDACPTRSAQVGDTVTRVYHLAPRIFPGFSVIPVMATRNPVNSPVEVGSLSHHLQGFIWWWRISSIIHRIMVHQQIQSYLVDICKTSLSPKWN